MGDPCDQAVQLFLHRGITPLTPVKTWNV